MSLLDRFDADLHGVALAGDLGPAPLHLGELVADLLESLVAWAVDDDVDLGRVPGGRYGEVRRGTGPPARRPPG